MKNFIFLLFLSIFFISCTNFIYSNNNYDDIISKTSIKPFEDLNKPIILSKPFIIQKGLFGNDSLFTENEKIGDIIIVYDWENSCIYDWCFTDYLKGWSNDRFAEIGFPTKYYSSEFNSDFIVELNSQTGVINKYDSLLSNTVKSLNHDKYTSNYALMDFQTFKDNKDYWQFIIFNSENKQSYENPIQMPTDSIGYISYPHVDNIGHYWLSYTNEGKNYLVEIVPENNIVLPPIFICNVNPETSYDVFDVLFADSNYVFLGDGGVGGASNLAYIYQKENNTFITIEVPKINEISYPYLYTGTEIDNNYYMIGCNNYYLYIFKINFETKKMEIITYKDFSFNNSIYIRDKKLIFINTNTQNHFNIVIYDTEKKSWSKEITFFE